MEMFSSSILEFWDMITGVIDDNKAKIIRFSCFGILIVGIFWAAFNYFKADRIADTSADSGYIDRYRAPRVEDTSELNNFAKLVKTISEIKQGSEAIAETITRINTKPFNTDGGLLTDYVPAEEEFIVQEPEIQSPQISVKAIISSNNSKAAIISAGGRNGLIVRRGDVLPNDLGRVTKIKSDGITVRVDNKKDFDFPVSQNSFNIENLK